MEYNLEEFTEKLVNQVDESFMTKIAESGLVETAAIPIAIMCPKHIYNVLKAMMLDINAYKRMVQGFCCQSTEKQSLYF